MDFGSDDVVLEGVFEVYGQSKPHHVILLRKTGFLYRKLKSGIGGGGQSDAHGVSKRVAAGAKIRSEDYSTYERLKFRDIVGSQCMKDASRPNAVDPNSQPGAQSSPPEPAYNDDDSSPSSCKAYFCVYAYALRKQRNTLKKGLKRQRVSVIVTIYQHDTFSENLVIAERWRDTIRMLLLNETGLGHSTDAVSHLIPSRKLLVFVSPKSGPGRALTIFKRRLAPMLAEAAISYDLIVTDRRNGARDYVRENNLDAWQGIVVVAGDGLIYEVVNGLMERSDWSTAIQKPIGVVPGGSGNGLAHSIAHALGEPQDTSSILLAAFNIAKGRTQPMDLVRIQTKTETIYSFLSAGWGLMADIDIESEALRALGDTRFTLWALHRIANLKTYRGRLSYMPVKDGSLGSCNKRDRQNEEDLEKNGSRAATAETTKDDTASVPCSSSASCSGQDFASCLVPLGDPVPSDWVQSEDDYVGIYSIYQTHLGEETYFAPRAKLNDGIMWLLVIRKGVTRSQMISFLLSLKTGGHEKLPFVEMYPVRAFRLEPITTGSHIVVDGELQDYGPIQGEVMPSMARMMVN